MPKQEGLVTWMELSDRAQAEEVARRTRVALLGRAGWYYVPANDQSARRMVAQGFRLLTAPKKGVDKPAQA